MLPFNHIWIPKSITASNSFTIFLAIFSVRGWEKKGSLSPASEGRGSKPSFPSHLYLCWDFFQMNCTANMFRGFQTCAAPKGEMTQHMHKGSWTFLDRSTATAKAKDGKAQHPENLAKSRKTIPHLPKSRKLLGQQNPTSQTAVPVQVIQNKELSIPAVSDTVCKAASAQNYIRMCSRPH